jgi:lipopolysaccharide biosynthesis glycosyltransferase
MQSPIHVATAADDNYAMPLAVMLASIQQSLGERPVRVHVLDGGITPDRKERVCRPLDPETVRVHWIEPDLSEIEALNTDGHVSLATYFRLLVPSHLPEALDRVIYLDVDLVVQCDLADVWNRIQGDAPLYAVQEGQRVVSGPKGVFNWQELGLPPDAPYLNAGVLGINLSRFREQRIDEQVVRYLQQHGERVHFWDQGGINALLAEKWAPLPYRWNQTHLIDRPDHWLERGVSPETYDQLRAQDACIIHYSGALKPWDYTCRDSRRDAFYEVLAHTEWADYEPPLPRLEQKVGVTVGRYLRAARRWWYE